ncbi:hypothetical protein F4778DRAFT_520995 [Xylariomycetidae sp. FL2044]|nr:hypothetical protein F4778DRAFT_520995 [Xylariomycetidae sp. FL2044]
MIIPLSFPLSSNQAFHTTPCVPSLHPYRKSVVAKMASSMLEARYRYLNNHYWRYEHDDEVPIAQGMANNATLGPCDMRINETSRRLAIERASSACSGHVMILDYCIGWDNENLVSQKCGKFYHNNQCNNCSVNKNFVLTCNNCTTSTGEDKKASIDLYESLEGNQVNTQPLLGSSTPIICPAIVLISNGTTTTSGAVALADSLRRPQGGFVRTLSGSAGDGLLWHFMVSFSPGSSSETDVKK